MAELTTGQIEVLKDIERRWAVVEHPSWPQTNTQAPIQALPAMITGPLAHAAIKDIPDLIAMIRQIRQKL